MLDKLVREVNSLNTTWTAQNYNISQATLESIASFNLNQVQWNEIKQAQNIKHTNSKMPIPVEFDPRKEWPKCIYLNEIRGEKECWPYPVCPTIGAMSDRICIISGQILIKKLSIIDVLQCCQLCNNSFPLNDLYFFKSTGICTESCKPISIVEHFINPSKCVNCSNSTYEIPYEKDKWFGLSPYAIGGVDNIQTELMTKGPAITSFTIYEDFLTYKSGVYQHQTGRYLGGHSVKILGWGVEKNVPY